MQCYEYHYAGQDVVNYPPQTETVIKTYPKTLPPIEIYMKNYNPVKPLANVKVTCNEMPDTIFGITDENGYCKLDSLIPASEYAGTVVSLTFEAEGYYTKTELLYPYETVLYVKLIPRE